MFDLKNFKNPVMFCVLEAALAALFYVLVIKGPLLDSFVDSGMPADVAPLVVGVVGFLIFVLMERVWRKFGPAGGEGGK